MKRTLLYLLLTCTALVSQAQMSKVYVNQYKSKKTTKIIPRDNLRKVYLQLNKKNIPSLDSLCFRSMDSSLLKFRCAEVDSVSFAEPYNLLTKENDYATRYSRWPSYSDNYINIASWSNKDSWNLANVHDPTVMRAADGYYYMYQTDASYGDAHKSSGGHFMCRRSQDLVNWTVIGPTMMKTPLWVLDSVNSIRNRMGLAALGSTSTNQPSYDYWAPCARMVNDTLYRMYYVIVLNNCIKTGSSTFDGSWGERAFIGLMETNNPASNNWTDKGYVICSASDKAMDAYTRNSESDYTTTYFRWNAIDPSYMITPEGKHWLIYGSWHSGECAIELNPTTGKADGIMGKEPWNIGTGITTTYGTRVNTRVPTGNYWARWQGSEAPEVIYNPNTEYYYLFLAYDGLADKYNTRVGRSKSITGPYLSMNGTNLTSTGGDCYPVLTHPYKFRSSNDIDQATGIWGYEGISHCCAFDDGWGNWYFACQARCEAGYQNNSYANALMMGHVRSMAWTADGWPVVMPERYANVAQASLNDSDLVGTWETIYLAYINGNDANTQDTSTYMSLASDHTFTNFNMGSSSNGGIYNTNGTWNFDSANNYLTLHVGGYTTAGYTYKFCVQRELDWELTTRKPTIVYAGYNSAGTRTYWGKKADN